MATTRQKQAIKKVIENHGNVSKSMRDVGYETQTAKNPSNLTDSKGYKELCIELGLTPNLIANSLRDDIESKEGNRVQELKLGADMLGMTKQDIKDKIKEGDTNINIENINILTDAKRKKFSKAISQLKGLETVSN